MEQQSQLVMERPLPDERSAAATPIKSILFTIHRDYDLENRLQVALSLARTFEAHLTCLSVTPIQAYSIVDTYGGTFVSTELIRSLEEDAQKLRVEIEEHLAREDVSWDYRQVTGELVPQILATGSLADLIVTGREPIQRELGGSALGILSDLLHSSRTPILVTEEKKRELDPLGPAVIAWNGSFEAANAVRASLGLLSRASKVQVIRIAEDKEEQFPPTRLLEYLSRHGIHADLTVRAQPKLDSAAELVAFAREQCAAYMVLGAYSHTRVGEFLFGGVTRELLKNCAIPLVLAR